MAHAVTYGSATHYKASATQGHTRVFAGNYEFNLVFSYELVRSIHEGFFYVFVFLNVSCLVAIMRDCHRHGVIYLYHMLVTKIRPPRVTGYMPPSGHWRFRGTMAPSRSKQAAPLAAGHPATTSGTDAGMYPVTQGGLILITKM